MTQLPARIVRTHLAVFSLAAPLSAILTYVLLSWIGGLDPHSGWTGKVLLFSVSVFNLYGISAIMLTRRIGWHLPLCCNTSVANINTCASWRGCCYRRSAHTMGEAGHNFSWNADSCFTCRSRWTWSLRHTHSRCHDGRFYTLEACNALMHGFYDPS